jgi:hypothetical protein
VDDLSKDRLNFVQYWSQVLHQYSSDLKKYCEDLSTTIPATSNTPFFFSLSWRKLSEFDWISLLLARDLLMDSDEFETMSKLGKWVLVELDQWLEKVAKRFEGIRFQQTLDQLFHSLILSNLETIDTSLFPAFQTFEGNIRRNIHGLLSKVFRITFQRPRNLKRKNRVRGYRDHGTESSVSDRARRKANTSTWNEYLDEVYQYCLLTGVHPSKALVVFNMSFKE